MADPAKPPLLHQARHAPDVTPKRWYVLAYVCVLCGRKEVLRKVSHHRKLLLYSNPRETDTKETFFLQKLNLSGAKPGFLNLSTAGIMAWIVPVMGGGCPENCSISDLYCPAPTSSHDDRKCLPTRSLNRCKGSDSRHTPCHLLWKVPDFQNGSRITGGRRRPWGQWGSNLMTCGVFPGK